MKYRLIAAAALLAALTAFSPVAALAAQYRGDASGSINVSETVNDDLYAGGGTVNVSAPVTGDVVAAGGTVNAAASIGGGLLAAGGNIAVMGSVGDDVRVVGGNILLNGAVSHDVIVLGGQVNVSGASSIGRDLVVFGGSVTVDGVVSGNLYVRGGDVILNGKVDGSADVSGSKIVFGPNASIGGKLIYSAPEEMRIRDGLAAAGVEFRQMQMRSAAENRGGVAAIMTVAFLIKILTLLALALILAAVFRRRVLALDRAALSSFGWNVLRGFGALILIPAAGIVLLFTVIGAPIAMIAFMGYGIVLILSGILAPIVLGSLAWKLIRRAPAYDVNAYAVLIGVALFALLGLIPVLGWLIGFVFMLAALGAITHSVSDALQSEQNGTKKAK